MYHLAIRCTQTIVLLLGVSFVTFALQVLSPGDFFQELRLNPQISNDTISRLRTENATDQPMLIRYRQWLRSAMHGDLGYSLAFDRAVAPLLEVRTRNTLFLTGVATCVAWSLALLGGIYCAQASPGWLDRSCSLAVSTLLLIPELLLCLCALTLALRTGWLPAGGMVSSGFEDLNLWNRIEDLGLHVSLPALVLSLGSLPALFCHVRTAMVEVLDSPFIQAARAHGISHHRLVFHHALPAAANPIISLFGISVSLLLSMSLPTEVIMSWPGLGPLLLDAVRARDTDLVIGATILSTTLLVVCGILADILLYALDPRVRLRSRKCG
jgi:peptide/nickel transport system permease protein